MIELQSVGKRFGQTWAVHAVSLSVAAGTICALVGSSGSGKSTTLRLINRLIALDEGRILIGGEDVRGLDPVALRRRVGYVIQSVGLFPHWTVARNVETVPRLLGWDAPRIARRVDALLDLAGLDPSLYRQRYPHELSGGQQQRVGVARALAADPEVLLMDEPFGALDPVTRTSLQDELLRIHKATAKTIVLVTHDVDEAIKLASSVAVMDAGRLIQCGTPHEILRHPRTDFVRDFVGGDKAGLRLLKVETVGARLRRGERADGDPVAADATLEDALAAMIASGRRSLPVVDARAAPVGALRLADIVA
jgi:osmoprotectant transport system ATP-binding protein